MGHSGAGASSKSNWSVVKLTTLNACERTNPMHSGTLMGRRLVLVLMLVLLWCMTSVASAAVGPWIRIDAPAGGSGYSAPASVPIWVSTGSTDPGTTVDPPFVTVNGEDVSNGTTLTNLGAGTYEIYAQANVYVGGIMQPDPIEASRTFTVTQPVQAALFLSQSVPVSMVVGQPYSVSVQMKNTGSATWTSGTNYLLGSQNPANNGTWGIARVGLAGAVANGQAATFSFTATAPSTPGTYNFQWQMLQEGVAWFGTSSPNQAITVHASTIYGNIDGLSNGMLLGWACSTRLNQSIDVHLYVGGPAGTGTGVGAYTANRSSEPGVAAACMNSGSAYRFEIPITQQMVTQHGGKSIYIHGISPVGAGNLTIAGSGAFNIPSNQAPVVSMTTPIDGATVNSSVGFTLQASATDADDGVAKVTFYANNQAVFTDVTAPYQHPMAPSSAGTHTYYAVAEDTRGKVTTSGAVTVNAIQPPWTPPLIPPGPGITRKYVYDQYHQLCKVIEPETGTTVMDYDGAGNLQWSASGLDYPSTAGCDTIAARDSGRKVTRYYDARNRVTTINYPDGNGDQNLTYWPDGLLRQAVTFNDQGTTSLVNTYAYNRRRMLTGEALGQSPYYSWGIGYAYDANASLAGQSFHDGSMVLFAPNALGQPTAVTDVAGNLYATGVQYYPNGAIKRFTYGNGIIHDMLQNSRQLPERSRDVGGPNTAMNYVYSYDKNGNVTAIADEALGANFSRLLNYDGLDRLTGAGSCSFGGDCWHRFSYDKFDNLTSWVLPGVKDYAFYGYVDNRLVNIQNIAGATTVGLDYDLQGNLRNKNGQLYEFDYGNRLRHVPGKEAYRYDALGRRIQAWNPALISILSQYSQAGQLLYQQDDRVGKSSYYIYLSGSLLAVREKTVSTGSVVTKYQHTDALGSPVAVSDQMAAVIERTQWEPYGAALNKPSYNGVGYTGHVMDGATGLTNMQQRYYDPQVGRFLSTDPVAANSTTGANFNRYWYANNNPYKFTDPDGRESACFSTGLGCGLRPYTAEDKKNMAIAMGGLAAMVALPFVAWEAGMAVLANPGAVVTAGEIAAGAAGVTGVASRFNVSAGAGAKLGNILASQAQRIQNAANRSGQTITLVGSRAAGTAGAKSDWDYVINANAATRNSLSRSLPGAGNMKEGVRPNIDVFKGEVDKARPFLEFRPQKK